MPKSRRKGGLSGVSKFLLDLTHADSDEMAKEPDEATDRAGSMVKRRKIDTTESSATIEGERNKNYDATGLVPHYTHLDQVPPHLQKC